MSTNPASYKCCMRKAARFMHLARALLESGQLRHALIDLRLAKRWRFAARLAAIMDAAKAKGSR